MGPNETDPRATAAKGRPLIPQGVLNVRYRSESSHLDAAFSTSLNELNGAALNELNGAAYDPRPSAPWGGFRKPGRQTVGRAEVYSPESPRHACSVSKRRAISARRSASSAASR